MHDHFSHPVRGGSVSCLRVRFLRDAQHQGFFLFIPFRLAAQRFRQQRRADKVPFPAEIEIVPGHGQLGAVRRGRQAESRREGDVNRTSERKEDRG